MMNFLDPKLLAWISKNKMTFLLVVLLMGNIYQYIDKTSIQRSHEEYIKQQNEYWKQRSEKLEFLFNTLINLENSKKK
jgi:hypothetical protein